MGGQKVSTMTNLKMYPVTVFCVFLLLKVSNCDNNTIVRKTSDSIKTKQYRVLLNSLKTRTLAQLNETDTTGKPTRLFYETGKMDIPTTAGFNKKAGKLYTVILKGLNEEVLARLIESIGKPKTLNSSISSSVPGFNLKDASVKIHNYLIDKMNEQIMDNISPKESPVKKHGLMGFEDLNPPTPKPELGYKEIASKIAGDLFNLAKAKVVDWMVLSGATGGAEGSPALGFDEGGSITTVDTQEPAKKVYYEILTQLDAKLSRHNVMGTSQTSVLGYDEARGPQAPDFKDLVKELKTLMDKEKQKQMLVNIVPKSAGNPGKGSVELLGEPNKDLVDAIDQFGLIYKRLLDEHLKNSFNLKDFTISFREPPGTSGELAGNVTFKEGVLVVSTPLEIREDAISVVVDNVVVPISYIYNIKQEVVKYQYVVDIPSKQMKGSFQANLRDVRTDAIVSATNSEGKCEYSPLGLHSRDPDFKKYEALFNTNQGFKDAKSTKKIELILNTVILDYIFRYRTKLPLIYDALHKVSVETTDKTAEEFHLKTKKDICSYNI